MPPEEAADLLLDKQKALEVQRLHMRHMLLESASQQVFWQIYKAPEAFKENKALRQEIPGPRLVFATGGSISQEFSHSAG